VAETVDPVRKRSVAAQAAVYGCVSSAIAVAVETTETRKAMAVTVVLTVLVYAATHGYAHILGAGAVRGNMSMRDKAMAFVDEWPLVCGGLPLLFGIAVGALLGFNLDRTAEFAEICAVVTLFVLGMRSAQVQGATRRGIVTAGCVDALFGVVIVGLAIELRH
jgi:hypothetical protein